MKIKSILTLALFLFGMVACTEFKNPVSSDPVKQIQSGSNENGSGSNENGSGSNENGSGSNENGSGSNENG